MKNLLYICGSNSKKKNMKRIFTFFSGMLCAGFLASQTTVTIGTGTTTTSHAPITGYYGYSYDQMIYSSADIIAGGGDVGMINKIRFYYDHGPFNNATNWTVYMGHTNKTAFANGTDWEPLANLNQVFSGTITMPAAGNWMEITLTTPFLWNGLNNLLIAVDENAPGYSSSDLYWRYTSTADNSSIYYYNDSNNPDPNSPPSATTNSYFPNLQLDMTITPCAGAPVHDIAMASVTNACIGDEITFSTDANATTAGMQYLWQFDNGGGWTDFINSNTTIFTTAELTQNSSVRVVATCLNSNLADTATPVMITINTPPVVDITPASYAVCAGGTASITASGAASYTWLPATDLDDPSLSTVVSTPTASTVYTVTGTDAAGCMNTATVEVNMMADLIPTLTLAPTTICTSGIPVDLTVGGLPSGISGGGTYEYQFLAADTVTVIQSWGAAATYHFTPATEQEYAFFYQVRNTACPGDPTDSIRVSFPVGFGADVAIQDYNCNHSGSLTLYDIFGQAQVTNVYSNLLNSSASLDHITLSGAAAITSGRAELTPSATGQSGYLLLDLDPVVLGLNNSMDVSFLLTADMPINNYGTGGADGIAYSFGDDALPSSPGPAHNGKGGKLRLSFDAADNSTENGNITGIYLVYGWTNSNAYGPGSAEVLAFSPNTSLWKFRTDVPVTLSVNTEGKATVTVDGTVIFNEIQLPASYMDEDVTNWNQLFSATTGGDALRQAISDFEISTHALNYGIVTGSSPVPPASWQAEPLFNTLSPGEYTLWISNPTDVSCRKNLGTYEVLDLNPQVELGNDTTICNGNNLMLNAGNPGASYLWSNGDTTQIITASLQGAYAVFVTDSVGCTDLGTINIDFAPVPSADGIYASGMFPTVFLSVINPSNTSLYNWNFGDGNIQNNAGSAVGHVYAIMGNYTVTASLVNDFNCDTIVITRMINVNNTPLSVEEDNTIDMVVYPNPTQDFVNVVLKDYTNAMVTAYTVSGSVMYTAPLTSNYINVQQWSSGVYFLKITQDERSNVVKVLVQH
jgi:hypothetical protein